MEGLVKSTRLADWLALPPSRVAVVGASGWIGMALVDRLLAALPSPDMPKLKLIGSAARAMQVAGRLLAVEPLAGAALGEGEWLVVNAAIVGADRLGGDWDRTRAANDAVLAQVLAVAGTAPTRRLVHLSSGAVGRPVGPSRQAYAQMKAAHERTVADWAGTHGRSLLMPRVFNLGGPYINHAGDYALGDFILQAWRTRKIVVGAAHPVFRNFVHVLEMTDVVLDMALDADPGPQVFDVAGGEVVELGDLARVVGDALGMADIEVERPAPSQRAADWYVGDGAAYQAALSRAGMTPVPLARMVADTAAYMRAVGLS